MRCHAFVLVGWIAHGLFCNVGADPTGSEERWLGGCGSVSQRRKSIPLCGGSGPVGTFRKVMMTCIYMHIYICIRIVLSVLAGTQVSMLSLRRK